MKQAPIRILSSDEVDDVSGGQKFKMPGDPGECHAETWSWAVTQVLNVFGLLK